MNENQPFRLGLEQASNRFPAEVVRLHQLRISAATRLIDLHNDYAFYTPALLYSYVPLKGHDPYNDFLIEYGKEVPPLILKFDRPIFEGLSFGWDRTLFAMEREHWPYFLAWMGTLAFMDRTSNTIVRLRTKVISVLDMLAVSKTVVSPEDCALVSVTVFCLDGSQQCVYIEERVQPLVNLPIVRGAPAMADTVVFGQALLRGDENPYRTVDNEVKPPNENRNGDDS